MFLSSSCYNFVRSQDWPENISFPYRLRQSLGSVPGKKNLIMFKAKNLTLILIGVMLFSLLLTVVGITLPISRKSDKIEEAGSQSMLSGDAIAIAMGHYSATSLRLLQEYPSESAAYRSLCGLLERMREHYGFQDVYTVTRNDMGYFYVLDSQYVQSETEGYHPIGSEFSFDSYGKRGQTAD